jgi:hypothetical protein
MEKDFDGGQPSAYGLTKTIGEALKSHPGVASAVPHANAARVTVISHGGKIFVVTTRRV